MMTKHHLNISSTSRLGYPHLRFLSGLGDGFLSQKSLLNATSFKFQIDKPKENDTKLILEHLNQPMAFRCGQNYTDGKNMLKT